MLIRWFSGRLPPLLMTMMTTLVAGTVLVDKSYENLGSVPLITSAATHVNLSNNRITTLPTGFRNGSHVPFMEVVDLSYNRLANILNVTLWRLAVANVSYNNLTTFPTFIFAPALRTLNVSHNRIRHVRQRHLDPLMSLQELYMKQNMLVSLSVVSQPPPDALRSLDFPDTLKILDVRSNNLTSILFPDEHDLKIILYDNPLICDCNLLWMLTVNIAGRGLVVERSNKPCHEPRSLRSVSWSQLSPELIKYCNKTNVLYQVEITSNATVSSQSHQNLELRVALKTDREIIELDARSALGNERVIIDANFTKIATLVNMTVTLSGIPQDVLPDWCVNQVIIKNTRTGLRKSVESCGDMIHQVPRGGKLIFHSQLTNWTWEDHNDGLLVTSVEWEDMVEQMNCPLIEDVAERYSAMPTPYNDVFQPSTGFVKGSVSIDGWDLNCGTPKNASIHDAATCIQAAGIQVYALLDQTTISKTRFGLFHGPAVPCHLMSDWKNRCRFVCHCGSHVDGNECNEILVLINGEAMSPSSRICGAWVETLTSLEKYIG